MTPRPILKARPSLESFPSPSAALPFKYSPHVHFPPTPTLTDTQMTHSPYVYDRAPIVVSPNMCQLPERGGRVYSASEPSSAPPKGSYFHPRAFEVAAPEPLNDPPHPLAPPPLIPDLTSSESEDSDACASSPVHSPPHDFRISPAPGRGTRYPTIITPTCSQDEALAFLPHPHSQASTKPRPKLSRRGTPKRPPTLHVKESFEEADRELSLDGCLGGF
ncbi:hypothetical protein LshimejAT787_1402160 [Lyophyllum shimeji]|uniref:Uncharacterized protein n=1 Tax=Lyophyllum shimeji TaxID=47721 RepID=A0A9P3UQA8_LYOSH|nr:hypothetical protein LshimejAT787_1402160 [Lyophyllum shimeji]